ncbi:metal ABC transporter permease [Fervidibacillus albus]|uniref:Metal ABC transporter permease n=1 Tax=Fervidibacillus albus TaxID=2980026 RepID=A0A9E8LV22_9BACI|nr:metal ABC transporter permease [Fervidibacillus albus]WAA10114.1 metal ABC transporter permease [Fervidibacillus albus]
MIQAIFEYAFLQNAVIAAVLISIVSGIIGAIVMEKKMVMMSGGIAHTAFGGIGLGYFLGISPMIGALLFSVISSFGIATIQRKQQTNTDILIGLFWAIGMAAGIMFIAFTPGYPPDMSTYLFGDILTVGRQDLWIMLVLDAIVVFFVFSLFNVYKAYLLDDDFAKVQGVKIVSLEYLLFFLIALTIVVMIRVVGFILVIALLSAPTAIAKYFTNNLKKMMILATLFSLLFSLTGLWISYRLNVPSGASIILLSGLIYILLTVWVGYRKKRKRQIQAQML